LTLAYPRTSLLYGYYGTTPDGRQVLLSIPVLSMLPLSIGPLRRPAVTRPFIPKSRVGGVKTGRLNALDLPGQIMLALALGSATPKEAKILRNHHAKVLDLVMSMTSHRKSSP
jgi:hypothetical protein